MHDRYHRTALPAITTPTVESLVRESGFLSHLVQSCGSPLYIMLPSEMEHNIQLFQTIFAKHDIEGRIWFAVKVNKAQALLEVAAYQGIGVEVSSLEELRAALGHGFPGSQIGVSGPGKSLSYLAVALRQRCAIVVDSLEELATIAMLYQKLQLSGQADVLLRLSGFEITTQGRSEPAPPSRENGRFGISEASLPELFAFLSRPEIKEQIHFNGFSFHIDNHSIRDRGEALAHVIEYLLAARSQGFQCQDIDIGGGFSARYVRQEHWENFLNEYALSLQSKRPSLMFRKKSFGLQFKEGQRCNRGNFYPYKAEAYKEQFLDTLLAYIPQGQSRSLAQIVRSQHIRLTIEPGKSLVDQSGLTLCQVRGIKKSTQGDALLLCEINISHLYEQAVGSEFAVDPLLLKAPDRTEPEEHSGFWGHVVGNLCLESDILTWRKIHFAQTPQPGDLLAFLNTAGYQMDFLESQIHQQRLARRIIVYQQAESWQWKLDEEFSGLDISRGD